MTEKSYKAKVKRDMIRAGLDPVKAVYDEAGNCVICGEAGHCPGWHDKSEIKPCGYAMHGGCNYPGQSGLRPFQCSTCNSGTLQNRLAALGN